MSTRWQPRGLAAVLLLSLLAPPTRAAAPQATPVAGVAFWAFDLSTGATVATEHGERLDVAIAPGSVMKVALLAAALEAGVVSPASSVMCPRRVEVGGHILTCTHPEFHRPLSAEEALAHSCNGYFAAIGQRVPRGAFDRALADLGLPPSNPSVSVALAGLGVEGAKLTPRQLARMMARVAAPGDGAGAPTWRASTRDVIRHALERAAISGTAAALSHGGVTALAKTGTVVSQGVAQGLVVGVAPAVEPRIGFVVLAQGGAGVDAAALAATRLAPLLARAPSSNRARVRVGSFQQGRWQVREESLDDYVASVVAGEAAAASPPAALEALAIAVRTYTVANAGRHAADGFDMCDLTHCQVPRASTHDSRQAARKTMGSILLEKGAPASVFYTASCGGHTERPSAVWPGAPDASYLPASPDAACEGLPAWRSDVDVATLQRALATGGFRGDALRQIAVRERTTSGRVAWLRLDGLVPPDVSGDDFRTLLGRHAGWNLVKSTKFDIVRTSRGYHLEGRGAGHGVGLCVLGGAQRAREGRSAREILAAYYPGLTLGSLSDGASAASSRSLSALSSPIAVSVRVPPSARASRHEIAAYATRTVRSLSQVLRLDSVEARLDTVDVRVHPTVEAYQRESRAPWFTAAATRVDAPRAARIDMQPLSALRAKGIFESTLTHELVHALTATTLAGRPRWVYEGIAAFYAREFIVDPSPAMRREGQASRCPEDSAFERPATADALRLAQIRAAECVARHIEAGRDWKVLQ